MNKVAISNQYSDTEVIQKIVEGEVDLFEILIRRNNPFLYKTGRSYGYNHEDTQDLMQDTFLKAYANLKKFENRSSFKTWIIRIMLNNCYKKRRKFSFKNEFAREIDDRSKTMFSKDEQMDMNKMMTNKELGAVIEKALENVALDYRMVFSFRAISGFSVKETAEMLAISETNVKVRHHRAKILLQKEIEKTYSPEDIFEFNLIYCDPMVDRVMEKIHDMQVEFF